MNQKITLLGMLLVGFSMFAQQTNPVITSWLQNTTGITGRHYVTTNPILVVDATLANVQTVQYNTTDVYVSATGIPAYITGPFLDGNPTIATAQNKIFKITLSPTQNTGTPTATTGGNIGVFINGVALFDYRDGVSYKSSTGANAGGPLGGMGDGVWNRDAVLAERGGFDCAKAHPANGNYHHHQNPSAFNLDLTVLSTVCNTYPADGLYVINPTQHSPLLGFAYDGFPIYGAYAYTNVNGTGGITRMKSSFSLRNITTRTHLYTGVDVTDGPAVSATYPLGLYREDYGFIANAGQDYLDIHNGRFCITPEYPSGIYCYFTTVNTTHNSTYPYVVGPTFYGNKVVTTVPTVPAGTTTLSSNTFENFDFKITIAPNPAQDFIAIQTQMAENNLKVELIDELGKIVKTSKILQGSTLSIIETDTVYNGIYFLKISDGKESKSFKVIINK